MSKKVQYLMIGGFLGAGKTTAILKLAGWLKGRGQRVGLITNDQSVDLVDTARARAEGFTVNEITGGCFCCKFGSLVEASEQLTRDTTPDVLIAEPVGSCTDLKATVSYPLRKLYGQAYAVGPLSVLVDPVRAGRVLGVAELAGGKTFTEKVMYVYRKQLEEAEILVVNKADLLSAGQRAALLGALQKQFPQAQVMTISCVTGEGLEAWFGRITTSELGHRAAMEVDYDVYADGEALLGWLNAKGAVAADREFDGNAWLVELAGKLRQRLAADGVEIAHLKMTLAPQEGPDLAAMSLTQTEAVPMLTHRLAAPLSRGELVVNLRAEADPELLKARVTAVAREAGVALEVLAAFRPGRPNPTHRMAGGAEG